MPQPSHGLISWRWTPSWLVPFVVVWPGTLAGWLLADPAHQESFLEAGVVVLPLSVLAALPFLVLGGAASLGWVGADTLKASVIGGALMAVLAWWLWNEYALGGVFLEAEGYFGLLAMYVALASPLLVGVGMGFGATVTRFRRL